MPVRERLEFTTGQLVKGSSFVFSYHLLRRYGNSRCESGFKAVLAKLGIPIWLDPEISYSVTIWYSLVSILEPEK